jgi:hypothetical protein
MDINGRLVKTISESAVQAGEHIAQWNSAGIAPGNYFARLSVGGMVYQTVKLAKAN